MQIFLRVQKIRITLISQENITFRAILIICIILPTILFLEPSLKTHLKQTSLWCDMSSDIFSKEINVSDYDLIYAGAQKT